MQPVFSPDGRSIDRPRAAPRRLRVRSLVSRRLRSRDRARSARCSRRPICRSDDFTFSPDGTTIWFTAASNGTRTSITVPAAGGAPKLAVAGRRGRRVPARQRLRRLLEVIARSRRADLYRVGRRRQATRQLTHENAAWLKRRRPAEAREPDRARRRRHAGSVLAAQAAELRRVEEVSGRLPDPRRSAGRVGRRVVDALESVALGGAGLGRRRAESARLDRLRPEVRRRDLAGLGRQGR